MSAYELITQNFDELYHHGIKGQKWGIRRYQNQDGTLTEAGKKRYGVDSTQKSIPQLELDRRLPKEKIVKLIKVLNNGKKTTKRKKKRLTLAKKQ